MKVLIVPKEFPHSKVIGGPIIIYNRIKYLSQNHKVGLVSFIREEDREYLPSVEPFLTDLELVPYPPKRSIPRRIRDFWFSDIPPYLCNTKSEQMRLKVGEVARTGNYNVVISEYTVMGQYLYKNECLPENIIKIQSCHECYYVARKRLLEFYGRFSSAGVTEMLRLKGLRKYEFDMYRSADKLLTLTEEEKQGILEIAPDIDIAVVPHGVDIEKFVPAEKEAQENAVVFLGNYPHDPNRDAVIYFYKQMWEKIEAEVPNLSFYIVGNKPTNDILALKNTPGITVTGRVDEVIPWLHKAKIFICPIRLGKGFRGKVLEAMAAGLPVVSTSLGAEGLPVEDGKNILIGNDPETFTNNVIKLFKDSELRQKVRVTGRKLIEEKFSWQAGVKVLEGIMEDVARSKR